jgi:VanZ family protein
MNPDRPNWRSLTVTAVVVISLIGWLDECRQLFTPGRSGNVFPDWIADFMGAMTGAFIFKALHHHLK